MVEEKLREKLDQKNSNQDIKGIKRTESGVRESKEIFHLAVW